MSGEISEADKILLPLVGTILAGFGTWIATSLTKLRDEFKVHQASKGHKLTVDAFAELEKDMIEGNNRLEKSLLHEISLLETKTGTLDKASSLNLERIRRLRGTLATHNSYLRETLNSLAMRIAIVEKIAAKNNNLITGSSNVNWPSDGHDTISPDPDDETEEND